MPSGSMIVGRLVRYFADDAGGASSQQLGFLLGVRFMDELEEDSDMRSRINLYKAATGQTPSVTETDEEDEVPKVPLEELLDDMTLGADVDMAGR